MGGYKRHKALLASLAGAYLFSIYLQARRLPCLENKKPFRLSPERPCIFCRGERITFGDPLMGGYKRYKALLASLAGAYLFSIYLQARRLPCLENKKPFRLSPERPCIFCRGERIRTSDLYVPNVAHYRAVLHPAKSGSKIGKLCV